MDWIRIRELVRKEFIQLFRDPMMRRILILAPFIQLLVFGYVATIEVRDIRVGFLDQARTRESRRVLDGFNANKTFRITSVANNEEDLEQVLLKGKADITVHVHPDFSAQIHRGNTGAIQILVDGTQSNMAAMRIAYTSQVIEGLNRFLLEELYGETITYGKIDDRIRTWYNPNLDSAYFFIPGVVALLVTLTTLLFTSMAIIREREVGTLEQLIVTPIKPFELILGKTIPYIIISVLQMILITLVAVLWFYVPLKGSVLLLFAGGCLYLLSTIGCGLFISTICTTQQQAMMTTFFFLVPCILLGGLIFPIANMPVLVQWTTYIIPLRFFLEIIRGIFLKGVDFSVLWPQYAALLVLGTILFVGAINRFRKRLD